VPISTKTGKPAGAFPKVNGPVGVCIADGAGGWYVGGRFTQVGDSPRKCIAHIKSDGVVDPVWNADVDCSYYPSVGALALSGTSSM